MELLTITKRGSALTWFSFGKGWVILRVGAANNEFGAHRDLLATKSPYFNRMFSQPCKEYHESVVNMTDEHPAVIHAYLNFLYYGTIAADKTNTNNDLHRWQLAVELWLFGERIQDVKFTNAAMDAILHKSHDLDEDGFRWLPTADTTKLVYSKTVSKSSPLRRLIIDLHVQYGNHAWYENNSYEDVHAEFTSDLVKALMQQRPVPDRPAPDALNNTCAYHMHEHGESCNSRST